MTFATYLIRDAGADAKSQPMFREPTPGKRYCGMEWVDGEPDRDGLLARYDGEGMWTGDQDTDESPDFDFGDMDYLAEQY